MKDIKTIRDTLTLKILDELSREISTSLGNELKQIVLYGSYARNEQSEESDIDIVVFWDGPRDRMLEIREKLSNIKVDLSLEYDVVISILLKEYRQYLTYKNVIPFYSNIDREGIALYEAA